MGGSLSRRFAFLLVVLAYGAPRVAWAEEAADKRVALVIGNGGYVHVSHLANPANDAKLVAATLRQLGFQLIGGGVQTDLDKPHFAQLVQDFGKAIQGAEVALFYYAGHGMQVAGTNWLVPTDANPTREQDLDFQMIDAGLVLRQMNGAGTRLNIVILDACRNNPFTTMATRAASGGLAEMRAPEGTLISFATQPGNVAADGAGADGPFAVALAQQMRRPGLDIFHLFNDVGLSVKRATSGSQQPWVSSSPIDGDFFFSRSEADTGSAPAAEPAPAATLPEPSAVRGPEKITQLRTLAGEGRPEAQTELGLAYLSGKGEARDPAEALRLFSVAAAQGFARAQFLSGLMQERGLGGAPRSYAAAVAWYRRAAEQNDAAAELALGRLYGRGLGVPQDAVQSAGWFRRAADQHNAAAEFALGLSYARGAGVKRDLPTAADWVRRAALQGYVSAEVRLGLMLIRGIAVPQNYTEAQHWLRLAADHGNAVAENHLGLLYRDGSGVARDEAEAARWFRQAAEHGNAFAALHLGLLYEQGLGVPRDPAQAQAWLHKAADAGNELAQAHLRKGGPRPDPAGGKPGSG